MQVGWNVIFMSNFLKVGANRLEQCLNQKFKKQSIKIYHGLCENMYFYKYFIMYLEIM
jgi:hypothetical protein